MASAVTEVADDQPRDGQPAPSSPVRLICDSDMWPKTMPSGANRNAQTSDAIAIALVGRRCG